MKENYKVSEEWEYNEEWYYILENRKRMKTWGNCSRRKNRKQNIYVIYIIIKL